MVMELVAMGSLDKVLVQFGDLLRTRVRLSMCQQVCSAVCELARERVLHRDLAARNVLVASIYPKVLVKVGGRAAAQRQHNRGGVRPVLRRAWGSVWAAAGALLGAQAAGSSCARPLLLLRSCQAAPPWS
jgi:serine/threonine protein kinase